MIADVISFPAAEAGELHSRFTTLAPTMKRAPTSPASLPSIRTTGHKLEADATVPRVEQVLAQTAAGFWMGLWRVCDDVV